MMKMPNMIGLLIAGLLSAQAVFAQDQSGPVLRRIGIYDSRSIAVAFVASVVYNETDGKVMAAKMAEHKKAKAEGDREKIKALEAWGEARQAMLHKQGFSTAPVEDILAHISDKLPDIMAQARVEAIVSKWDETALAQYPDAEKIDVTMLLLDAFGPNERQRKAAVEIRNHDPVPLEKMTNHGH